MKLKFASWNVNYRNFKPDHYRLIDKVNADVIALQEVSHHFQTGLETSELYGWSRSSLAIVPPASDAPRSRRLGCSVFGKAWCSPIKAAVLPDVAFPERTIIIEAQTPVGNINFCNFHIPPGASWKSIKPKTMISIAAHLSRLPGNIVVGMDANAPKIDHPDHCQNTWWWDDEPRLLGHNAYHHLNDALRVYLSDHSEEYKKLTTDRPNGPLACSHLRGRGSARTSCRYDFVLISPEIKVRSIDYLFTESVAAGSDHALVVAELELSSSTGARLRSPL